MEADDMPIFSDGPQAATALVPAAVLQGPWLAPDIAPKPIEQRIGLEVVAIREAVKAWVVTADNLERSYAFLRHINVIRKEWSAHMTPHIEGAQESKRVAEANRKRLVTDFESKDTPLLDDEKALGTKIGTLVDRLEAERLAEQARLQAEVTKAAEDAALEQAAALTKEAETAPPAVAEALRQAAEQVISEPVFGATVSLPAVKPTKTGHARPEYWKAELFDLPLLLKALNDKKLDKVLTYELVTRIAEAVMPSLNSRASSLKAALNIPGVRAVSEKRHRMR